MFKPLMSKHIKQVNRNIKELIDHCFQEHHDISCEAVIYMKNGTYPQFYTIELAL
jgi:hypothetical protein